MEMSVQVPRVQALGEVRVGNRILRSGRGNSRLGSVGKARLGEGWLASPWPRVHGAEEVADKLI